MNPVLFVADYIRWHYSLALFDILRVWGNFMWFVLHVSSTGLLIKTFLSPWKRMHEEKPPKGTFDPGYYAGSILVNALMRIVGMGIRSFIIALSLLVFGAVFLLGLVFVGFWVVAPIAIFIMFGSGLTLIGL